MNVADIAEQNAVRALEASGGPRELAEVTVELDDAVRPEAGSRPAFIVRGAAGRRYFFKSAPPEQVAAEILAYDVRKLGKRPTLPTSARTLTLPEIGTVSGMLQPLLSHSGERLPTDPSRWSELQREVMLREHPWEWLLANLDTHVDQYVLFGADRMPLNVDWDHALVDLQIDSLDRFTKRSPAIAPIRNALYDAYVRGALALDFGGLRREVRHIARIDDRLLFRALERWADAAGVDAARKQQVARQVLRRKRRIHDTFFVLLRELRRERMSRRPEGKPLPLRERARIAALDAWQRLLIDTLHDRAVVPWLRVYRRILQAKDSLARGHRRT